MKEGGGGGGTDGNEEMYLVMKEEKKRTTKMSIYMSSPMCPSGTSDNGFFSTVHGEYIVGLWSPRPFFNSLDSFIKVFSGL